SPRKSASQTMNTSSGNDDDSIAPGSSVFQSEIFGRPLTDSLALASITISTTYKKHPDDAYGKIPVVVAKCGLFLKENATEVEGIFRLSGSAKRIRELQEAFSAPPNYGRDLSWDGYLVHDAANVLRRYLNNLPEPIIPLEFYDEFRASFTPEQKESLSAREICANLLDLIAKLPSANRELLLYILDLLSVFDKCALKNRMPAQNLAAIFQPCLLNHPQHATKIDEYLVSQDALVFMITHSDEFL
ncbi:hypothetical protein CANCADRAFT_20500, partial [Tortispora caseinolytica NRRL Y-17796]